MSADGSAGAAPRGAAARIVLRPLASALPLGFFSFGIGMLLLAGQEARWIPVGEAHQVGLVLAAFVFPLEGLSAIFAFLARDVLSCTALGLFATSWLTIGLSLLTADPGTTSVALGFYLFGFTAAILSLGVTGALGKPLIALILTVAAARSTLDGIYEVGGSSGVSTAAGITAVVIAGLAWYGGTAFLLEDLKQRAVLPVFRIGASRQARDAPLAEQLASLPHEAGVRQQF